MIMHHSSTRAIRYYFGLLSFCLSLSSCAVDSTIQLIPKGADPFIHVDNVNIGYYLYVTNSKEANVPAYVSHNLRSWDYYGDAMPALPNWVKPGYVWAPEVIQLGDRYLLYYTGRNANTDLPCIGVAFSSSPTGPFKYTDNSPLLCDDDEGGAIDATPFLDSNNQVYLLFKGNGNRIKRKATIQIIKLTADGLGIIPPAKRLIQNDAPWEGISIEAPTMVYWNRAYYLFYSGAMYGTPRYAVGYARSYSVEGPFSKYNYNPILKQDGAYNGTGHQSVFTDHYGNSWMVYHARRNSSDENSRGVYLKTLTWVNGVPLIQ